MSQECRIPRAIVALALAVLSVHHVDAQSILDRARKTAQDAANAGKKAVTDEANRQLQSAVRDAAAENVADGSFVAVLTPWSSSDGNKRVELARYTGSAFVVSSGGGEEIVICDSKGVQAWETTFTVQNAPAGGAAGGAGRGGGRGADSSESGAGTGAGGRAAGTTSSGGRGGSGATAGTGSSGGGRGSGGAAAGTGNSGSGRGGGGASGTSGSGGGRGGNGTAGTSGGRGASTSSGGASGGAGSTGRGGRSGGAASGPDSAGSQGAAGGRANGAAPPSATEHKFEFPSKAVAIAFPAVGAKSGAPSEGSFTLGDVSQSVVAGAAKLRFSQATIPGEKGPQVVDFGVAFKARAVTQQEIPAGCLSPNGGRGQNAVGARGAAPGGRAAGAQATGATAGAAQAFAEGDYLYPKIDNLKLLAASNDTAKLVATIRLNTALVYLGDEQNGYVHVQGSAGDGWIRKALLIKR